MSGDQIFEWVSKNGGKALLILLALLVAGFVVLWVGESWMEARTYNQVTGSHVTTWQAMWVDLRVYGEPKQ